MILTDNRTRCIITKYDECANMCIFVRATPLGLVKCSNTVFGILRVRITLNRYNSCHICRIKHWESRNDIAFGRNLNLTKVLECHIIVGHCFKPLTDLEIESNKIGVTCTGNEILDIKVITLDFRILYSFDAVLPKLNVKIEI